MKTSTLLLLVMIAAPAAAQPAPKAPAPGTVYPPPATLPKDKLPGVVEYARASKGFPAVPEKIPPTLVHDLDGFARSVEQIRRELDNAAIVLHALQSDEMKAVLSDAERQRLIGRMTEDFNNRNAWLDKMGSSFVDTHFPKPVAQPRYEGPSIGLPSRPTRAAYVPRSAAGIIVEKGFPGGPGASLHPVTRAISSGWTAGAWVGNEVMIKEELRQSWKAQDDLRRAQKEWDEKVKPQWEENRRNERADRARADAQAARVAPTMMRIFQALFSARPFIVPAPAPVTNPPKVSSLPPILPPSFGSTGGYGSLGGNGPYGGGMYNGGYGYSGNRYGSSSGMGGYGPYGGGNGSLGGGGAIGAGMRR